MTRLTILGLTAILLSACYVDPPPYVAPLPYWYANNEPPGPDRPDKPHKHGHSVPPLQEPDPETAHPETPDPETIEPQADSQPSDTDDGMRSAEVEEVIGGDEPTPDRSRARVKRPLPVERHRDHGGDYTH
jgi:hypothetical protein